MSSFDAGYEFRKLSERVELLERKIYGKKGKKQQPLFDSDDSPIIEGVQNLEVVATEANDNVSTLAVEWLPPFTDRCRTWDSGSRGNLHVNGSADCEEGTGGLIIRATHADYDVNNSDRGSRFLEAKYAFVYRNPFTKGKLRIRAEYFINEGRIRDEVIDENGPSAVDTLVLQRFRMVVWKDINGSWETMKEDIQTPPYHEHETTYNYGEGGRGHSYTKNKANRSNIHEVTTDLELEKNQSALIYAGISSGLSFWTDDFSVNHHTVFKVRLDKIIVEII